MFRMIIGFICCYLMFYFGISAAVKYSLFAKPRRNRQVLYSLACAGVTVLFIALFIWLF